MSVPMRTIWVAIRGANYTDRATRQVGKNIDKLIIKQQQLRRAAIMMAAGGVLWTAMAAMATAAMMGIMEKTVEGRQIMRGFGRATEAMLKNLGAGIVDVMGPTLKMMTGFFNIMAKYPIVGKMVAILANLVIVLLLYKGITMLASAASAMLSLSFFTASKSAQQYTFNAQGVAMANVGVGISFKTLQASMGPALLAFTMFYQIGVMIGDYAPVLIAIIGTLTAAMVIYAAATWSAATALSILTFGAAAMLGVGAAIAAHAAMPSYQMGTKFVGKTGVAMVHEGEEIISAREKGGRRIMDTEGRFPRTSSQISISIGTVQTKADKEELTPLIKKILKNAMDDKV